MKVVILGKYLLDESTPNGALRHTVGLCTALEKIANIDLHIVTLGEESYSKKIGNKIIHVVKKKSRPFENMLLSAYPLVKIIRKLDPDVIHCVGTTQPYGIPPLILSKWYGYKVIVSILGLVQNEVDHWNKNNKVKYLIQKHWYPFIEKQVLRSFPLIAQTKSVKDLVTLMTPQPVYVIPLGVDDAFFSLASGRKIFGCLLCVAVIWPRKGQMDLLKALTQLNDLSQIQLNFVGAVKDPHYFEEMKHFIEENNLSQNVTFKGVANQVELERLFQDAMIMILPSLNEAFGLVIIEAMAAGVPIISTRSGGPEDIIENKKDGILVPTGFPEDLACAIELLLHDDQLTEQLAINGKKKAKRYSWQYLAADTYNIYQKVLAN